MSVATSDTQASLSRENEATYRRLTWRLIPFFCLCYFASYLDRVNIGIAKLQMLDDLHFSNTAYGLGAGLFFVGYVLLEVPSNLMLHRVGAKIWLARIMITWGVISGATAWVQTPMQFYVLRLLLGAAEAGFLPGVVLYLTNWYPAQRRSKILSLFLVGLPLASLLGGPLSGWIMTAFSGVAGWAGWQWMFVIEALPSVVLGLILLIYLPNSIQDARWLTNAEKTQLQHQLARDRGAAEHHSVWTVMKNPKVWLLGCVCMSAGATIYIISFWLPTVIRDAGVVSPFHVGLLIAIPNAAAIALMVLVSSHSDRTQERRWHLSIVLLIAAISLCVSALIPSNIVSTVALMTIANACVFAALPVFWCLPSEFLSGKGAAAGIALINSIASSGGFAATFLLGWIKDKTGSINAGMLLFSVVLVVAVAIVLRIKRPAALGAAPLPAVK